MCAAAAAPRASIVASCHYITTGEEILSYPDDRPQTPCNGIFAGMSTPSLAHPPGLWRRLAASVYDGLLVLAICMSITVVAMPALTFVGGSSDRAMLQALMVLGNWFYFTRSWTRGGQTLGMRAWHLRLRRADSDAAPSLTLASARFFLMLLLCILPLVVGGLAAIEDRSNAPAWLLLWLLPAFCMGLATIGSRRALHDLVSASEVIVERPADESAHA